MAHGGQREINGVGSHANHTRLPLCYSVCAVVHGASCELRVDDTNTEEKWGETYPTSQPSSTSNSSETNPRGGGCAAAVPAFASAGSCAGDSVAMR